VLSTEIFLIMKKYILSFYLFFICWSLYSQEVDYKSVFNNTFSVMDKIIESDVDLNRINEPNFFNDELNISDEELNSLILSIKNAGEFTMKSQNIKEQDCFGCKSISNDKIVSTFKYFRENKEEYNNFKASIKNVFWNDFRPNDNSNGCNNYICYCACLAVCSATFPSFPIYLCCAYLCYNDCCSKLEAPKNHFNNSH
jgi:hypothetical protein